ncbi:LytR/AlgR family response regulator transcription factor [Niabella sp. CJ426]|uniref:LytR/AlgR family response regulator transcription factor n=1 Tax=Niabella sp. CJ426 TaxID=3393740 RepID=UPI003D07B59D
MLFNTPFKKINCYIASQDDGIVNRFAQLINTVPELRLMVAGQDVNDTLEGLRTGRLRAGILFTCINELSSIDIASLHEICQHTAVIMIGGSEQVNKPALDAGAINYLPRAVSEARFANYIQLAERWLLDINEKKANYIDAIFLRESINQVSRVKLAEILWVKADQAGTVCHTVHGLTLKGTSSMNKVEAALPEDQLVRIHQCYIVNLAYIEMVGENELTVEGGRKLPIGDSYKDNLLERLVIL